MSLAVAQPSPALPSPEARGLGTHTPRPSLVGLIPASTLPSSLPSQLSRAFWKAVLQLRLGPCPPIPTPASADTPRQGLALHRGGGQVEVQGEVSGLAPLELGAPPQFLWACPTPSTFLPVEVGGGFSLFLFPSRLWVLTPPPTDLPMPCLAPPLGRSAKRRQVQAGGCPATGAFSSFQQLGVGHLPRLGVTPRCTVCSPPGGPW